MCACLCKSVSVDVIFVFFSVSLVVLSVVGDLALGIECAYTNAFLRAQFENFMLYSISHTDIYTLT